MPSQDFFRQLDAPYAAGRRDGAKAFLAREAEHAQGEAAKALV